MKRLYSLLLALGLLFLLSLTAAGADRGGVTITVDGQILDTEEAYINDRGVTMIPLRAAAEALGYTVNGDPRTRTAAITSAPAEEGPASGEDEEERVPLVVLDPGHGGSARGASYGGVDEKDLNLSIALQAGALLEEAGLEVILTRTDDRDVGLYDRTAMANGQQADLFVSVHCNASLTNPEARGIYTAAYSEECIGWQLAQLLRQTMMEAAGAEDMGSEARPNLAVLRTAQMPAALVECGYMSTPGELALLAEADYQARLAQGIADGVLAYLALAG